MIFNRRYNRRMSYSQVIAIMKDAVKDLVYNISLTSAATEKLDAWEEGSTPVILLGRW